MDVKSTFSNVELEEEIYVKQPAGYIEEGEHKVLKCYRSLFSLGFEKRLLEHAMYK